MLHLGTGLHWLSVTFLYPVEIDKLSMRGYMRKWGVINDDAFAVTSVMIKKQLQSYYNDPIWHAQLEYQVLNS